MMKKISQVELVKYVDELDEKLNDKKVKDILYKQYFGKRKNTRKTKNDKRYQIISQLARDNFNTSIGETTVWRILKIKNKSKKAFDEIKTGDRAIKETYNSLFGVNEAEKVKKEKPVSLKENNEEMKIDSIFLNKEDDIISVLKQMEISIANNKEYFCDFQKLRELDNELFILRKLVLKTMQYHDNDF